MQIVQIRMRRLIRVCTVVDVHYIGELTIVPHINYLFCKLKTELYKIAGVTSFYGNDREDPIQIIIQFPSKRKDWPSLERILMMFNTVCECKWQGNHD